MAKKKKVEAQPEVTELTMEAPTAAANIGGVTVNVENPPQEPKSDMYRVYLAVRERLEAEELTVNDANPMATQVRIESDFVEDCTAMIPAILGAGPEYPAWNFPALIYAIVPKGDNTAMRLEILKNVVRAALVGPSFNLVGREEFRTSIIITDEKDSRALGVRTSAISLLIRIERIKKLRR